MVMVPKLFHEEQRCPLVFRFQLASQVTTHFASGESSISTSRLPGSDCVGHDAAARRARGGCGRGWRGGEVLMDGEVWK